MKLLLAQSAGFCFGVDRAVSMTEAALEDGPCWSVGELIHNRGVVERLEARGLRTAASAEDVPAGARVIVRSHGVSRRELEALADKGCTVIDATCPKVGRIHRIAQEACARGRRVVILGEASHPEVRGICGWCENAVVLPDADALRAWLEALPDGGSVPVTVVFQTTSDKKKIEQSINSFKNLYTNLEIFDTICNATDIRQKEARDLAARCDAMVVVGGLHSANSVHLAEICAESCRKVLFVQNAGDLNAGILLDCDTVGVTAGASTPAWNIKEVVNKMNEVPEILEEKENPAEEPVAEVAPVAEEAAVVEETPAVEETPVAEEAPAAEETAAVEDEPAAEPVEEPAPVPEGEKTFDQLLEDSIKSISNGDTVTGIVVAVTPTEITLDLSTKHSAYIPVSEFTNDVPGVDINDLVHIGDAIQASVVRVNDVEGTAQLSKRRLDAARGWDDLSAAREDATVLEGKVVEDNKGGVVVNIRGMRVFVPASQTALGRNEPMSTLVGQTVRLKITEVDRGKKRVVGSIRSVMFKERRERAEKIWSEIEVGKKYDGTVKSLTSYGAFVDIGGVDGMVHVSEISWDRIRNPGDVLHVGDEVEVYVIGFDPEKKKISLGYRKQEDNPWNKFVSVYAVGDIAKVKIVKLMPFGAFAEVVDGVDGLIHISQIANRRIGKPDEVLSVGDYVDAKITAIDNDKQKISLSIRALIEPAPAPARKPREDRKPQPENDALVYEISATGEATGFAPEEDELPED